MHTLHYWAVEADNKEEAFDKVKTWLTEKSPEWSHWHTVGGGRMLGAKNEDSPSTVISYYENPEKFKEIFEDCKQKRRDEMNHIMLSFKPDLFISDMVDYISSDLSVPDNNRFSNNTYLAKCGAGMLDESYSHYSYMYDLKEYTAYLGFIKERLDNPEITELQFLVPIDFHF